MILVDWEIKQAVKTGLIEISPFEPRLVQPNSIDIRLGSNFAWYTSTELIDVYDKDTINSHFVTMQSSNFDITPNEFVLAETLEKITLPKNIVASIEGKSSLARLGLSLHQTGGWIDAGFSGTITLELYNANRRSIKLYSGMPIGQLVFYQTKECKRGYGEKLDAKYQNQKGATISKYENSLLTFNTKTQY